MVEEEAYCIDVIRQIQAVQAALNKISAMILEEHLNSCLITAVRGDDRPSVSASSVRSPTSSKPPPRPDLPCPCCID